MPPQVNDEGITDQQFLLRVLLKNWLTIDAGRERPTTEAFTDSNYENSCFVEGEISIEQIQEFLAGQSDIFDREIVIARIPVALIRAAGFIIERRADEAEGCQNPNSHVVVGPQEALGRAQYQNRVRTMVKDARVTIIRHVRRN